MEMLVGQAAIEAAKIAVLLIIVSVTTFVSNLVGIGLIIRRKTNLKLILQCMFLFVSCFLVLLFWGKLNIAGLIFIFLISKVIFFCLEWYLSCSNYEISWDYFRISLLYFTTLVASLLLFYSGNLGITFSFVYFLSYGFLLFGILKFVNA